MVINCTFFLAGDMGGADAWLRDVALFAVDPSHEVLQVLGCCELVGRWRVHWLQPLFAGFIG